VNEALDRLAKDYWEFVTESSPVEALMRGDHRYDDRFDDVSLEAENATIARRREFAAAAEQIDPGSLTADEKITREVLIHLARANADYEEQRLAELDVNHAVGMQAMLPVAVPQYPLTAPEHALAMPSHFRGMARALDDAADRLRSGVAGGRTPMASTATKTVAQIDAWLAGDPGSDPLLKLRSPQGWDGEAAWRQDMARVVADEVRRLAESKHVVALANSLTASAAYWLASQADEIVAAPEALVGSVGVFAVHEDWSKVWEQAGLKLTYITAGKYKVEGNFDEPLSDEARAHIQGIVDDAYSLFVSDVAKGRGVSAETVRADYGEGRVLTAKDAKAVGMVDRVAGLEETIRRLTGIKSKADAPALAQGDNTASDGSRGLLENQRRRLEIAERFLFWQPDRAAQASDKEMKR